MADKDTETRQKAILKASEVKRDDDGKITSVTWEYEPDISPSILPIFYYTKSNEIKWQYKKIDWDSISKNDDIFREKDGKYYITVNKDFSISQISSSLVWERKKKVYIDKQGNFVVSSTDDTEVSLSLGGLKPFTMKSYSGYAGASLKDADYNMVQIFHKKINSNTNENKIYVSTDNGKNKMRDLSLLGKTITMYSTTETKKDTSSSFISLNSNNIKGTLKQDEKNNQILGFDIDKDEGITLNALDTKKHIAIKNNYGGDGTILLEQKSNKDKDDKYNYRTIIIKDSASGSGPLRQNKGITIVHSANKQWSGISIKNTKLKIGSTDTINIYLNKENSDNSISITSGNITGKSSGNIHLYSHNEGSGHTQKLQLNEATAILGEDTEILTLDRGENRRATLQALNMIYLKTPRKVIIGNYIKGKDDTCATINHGTLTSTGLIKGNNNIETNNFYITGKDAFHFDSSGLYVGNTYLKNGASSVINGALTTKGALTAHGNITAGSGASKYNVSAKDFLFLG